MGDLLRSKGFIWLSTSNLYIGGWQQAGNVLKIEVVGPWDLEINEESTSEAFVSSSWDLTTKPLSFWMGICSLFFAFWSINSEGNQILQSLGFLP